MNKTIDCIIVGAGIAGITAAIYLKRWGFQILLLEKNMPGGSINQTTSIENYPGMPNINGTDLSLNLYKQIQNLKINYQYSDVLSIQKDKSNFIVITDQKEFSTKTVILATGRKPRQLGLENENQLLGHGISTCATCDGPIYKDQEVCIVGGGNSALEESLYLATICKKVTIINRSSVLRADKVLQEKVNEMSNIIVLYNTKVTKLMEKENQLKSIEIQTEETSKQIHCTGLFISIGSEPIYPSIDGLKTNNNYIIVNDKMQTNIDGICACGDIIKKELYQMITAASEGAIAANTTKNYLNQNL